MQITTGSDIIAATGAFRRGQVVLVEDTARPDRGGALVAAAERTSDDVINFMVTHGRGLVCLALLPDRIERLGLEASEAADGLDRERFTASIEARRGVTTGISAQDRAETIRVAADLASRADDIVTPGHVFPVAADPAGVVVCRGWAEVGVDLGRAAGLQPAATYCRVLDDAGEIAAAPTLARLAELHGLPHIRIDDLVAHRMASETFMTQRTQAQLPTAHGDFIVRAFENQLGARQHLALTLGEIRSAEPILVRVHSECLTGDVFGSWRCDCGAQLEAALAQIRREGRGVLLYLRQEGRGVGLANKLRAYALQDEGRDTVEANVELGLPVDRRDYGLAVQMLLALGVGRIRLLTNNPRKVEGLTAQGVEVVAREPLEVAANASAQGYLATKKRRLGHMLENV